MPLLMPAWAPLAALAIAPVAIAIGFVIAPWLRVGDLAAGAIAAAYTSGVALVALALASRAEPPRHARIFLFVVGVAVLLAFAFLGVASAAAVSVVAGALVAATFALGDGIGRRIMHPGHVAPACAVAAAADIASVVAPEGPTRAIAASDTALSVLAIAGPVPGHAGAIAPTLGAGDLVFAALLLGAAASHGVGRARVTLAIALGITLSLALSATLETAVPALPAIGALAVAMVPAFRDLRPADRRGARIGIALALGLALAAVARRLLAG